MRGHLLNVDGVNPEHAKDPIDVIVEEPGEYNPDTGEYDPPQEVVMWSGMGSIQPYVRVSMTAIQEPIGGIALAVDAFKIYLPHEALNRGDAGYRIRSNGRYFEPKHDPLDVGGRKRHWIVIAAEVNRTGPGSGGAGAPNP